MNLDASFMELRRIQIEPGHSPTAGKLEGWAEESRKSNFSRPRIIAPFVRKRSAAHQDELYASPASDRIEPQHQGIDLLIYKICGAG